MIVLICEESVVAVFFFFFPFFSPCPLSSPQGQAGARPLLLNLALKLFQAWTGVMKLSLLKTGRKAPAGDFQRAKELSEGLGAGRQSGNHWILYCNEG